MSDSDQSNKFSPKPDDVELPLDICGEVATRWGLVPTESNAPQNSAALLDFLERKIADMLLFDRRKLFQAFYRLDVDDERVAQVLRTPDSPKVHARRLAELVVKREVQKAQSRRQHSPPGSSSSSSS